MRSILRIQYPFFEKQALNKNVIFYNPNPLSKTKISQIPYEIKEQGVIASIGISFSTLSGLWIHPFMYYLISLFGANFFIQSFKLMLNAIIKIELLENGKCELLTKYGKKYIVETKSIKKLINENTLNETFVEPYLFPIQASLKNNKVKKFYLFGEGRKSIIDGEKFRKLINSELK